MSMIKFEHEQSFKTLGPDQSSDILFFFFAIYLFYREPVLVSIRKAKPILTCVWGVVGVPVIFLASPPPNMDIFRSL